MTPCTSIYAENPNQSTHAQVLKSRATEEALFPDRLFLPTAGQVANQKRKVGKTERGRERKPPPAGWGFSREGPTGSSIREVNVCDSGPHSDAKRKGISAKVFPVVCVITSSASHSEQPRAPSISRSYSAHEEKTA